MKAVQVVGFERAVLADVPVPVPGPDEILALVKRVGICGSDVRVFRQELEIYRAGRASLPIIPGHEWAGEVVEMGTAVRGFRVGDRVTGECGLGCNRCWLCRQGLHNICPDRVETGVFNRQGAYAEYVTVPFEHAHKLYDLSFQEGALVEPCTVGLWIARRAGIQPGDRVAIIGSGTVGLVALQGARLAGAELLMTVDRFPFKLNLARELGADVVVNFEERKLEEAIPEITNGRGFNVVIEATGVPAGVTAALRAAAPRARVIVTGVFEGEIHTADLNTIMPKELTVIGSLGGPTVFEEAIDLVRRGKMKVQPINTHTVPLTEGVQALEMVAKGQPNVVKVQLDCS